MSFLVPTRNRHGASAGHSVSTQPDRSPSDIPDDRWLSDLRDELAGLSLSSSDEIPCPHYDELGQMGPDVRHDYDPTVEPQARHGSYDL